MDLPGHCPRGAKKGVKMMFVRVLPVIVVLLLTLFPFDMAYGRDPMITPEGMKVKEAAALLNDQGVQLYHEGRLEEALGSFIMASHTDPAFAIAHYNCAVVLTTRGFKGDVEEAMRHLEWSYNLDPDNEAIEGFLIELMNQVPLKT
jgi:tetratricopeptide (TPR) repeat protein